MLLQDGRAAFPPTHRSSTACRETVKEHGIKR